METSNMKNIVVLKNVPSNLVDEAIIILKTNKNAKKLEYACNSKTGDLCNKTGTADYIIKEAESVISNYISKIEKPKKIKNENNVLDKKYLGLKTYSIVVSVILILVFIKSLI